MTDPRKTFAGALLVGFLLCCLGAGAGAAPITPTRDDEVVEVLPAISGGRAEAKRLRRELEASPRDPALAVSVARRYLDQAHELGDPRFAGLAMAALAGFPDDAQAPSPVLLMRATLQQYLHEFDASASTLQRLLARPDGQVDAQAWLTLATVRRVQGRYDESDAACRHVAALARLHGSACLAENAALRGDTASARTTFAGLVQTAGLPPSTLGWLMTTQAELEQRDGRAAEADARFRGVLALQPDAYATIAYADFLIDQKRPVEALKLLKDEPRTDSVVLRLAIAGTQAKTPGAAADVAEMRDRITLANQRPDARKFHGREQAMFALAVDRDATLAVDLARGDIEQQREPLDILVLARAARQAGDAAAMAEARRWKTQMGLHDRRIDALL